MAIAAIGERGAFRGALLGGVAAAGTERAAGRHIERTRHVAGEDDALPLARGLRVRDGDGGEQRLGIRMDGVLVQVVRVRNLDHLAEVHDGDALRDVMDDEQIVRNEQIRHAELLLKLFEHVDDLRLDRHVERGDRLVADDELRVDREGAGDANALPLAAGKLMGVAAGMLGVQADIVHQLKDLFPALFFVGVEMVDVQRLTDDVLDGHTRVEQFPEDDGEDYDEDVIKVAIIGKPNVGKSSLLNRILGEERVIVSNIAGTTRDAIDSYFENEFGKYLFIDTAGMRRKSKVDDAVERYSNLRTVSAIERADVCLILIDANEGVTEQDTKVAGLAHEAGKASIIVVNKWDAVEKDTNTMNEMTNNIRRDLSYMTYAPVVFISALTGQRVDKLFEMINAVSNQNSMRITTGMLNNILEDATARVQPPTDKGRRLKIYYMTQVGVKPPHFVIFCNDARLFHFSYQRYLENQIRAVFGLTGTPVKITIRQKGDDAEK